MASHSAQKVLPWKGGKRNINLSNMSFAAPSCLLFFFHYRLLCANIATLWLLPPSFMYLFIYLSICFIEGGGRNNLSHLDINNWVIFGMAQSQEMFNVAVWNIRHHKDEHRFLASQPL